jgi:putative membrane protein
MANWLVQHGKPIVDSVIYSVLGMIILLATFYVIHRILPFSMQKEIAEDQNLALGVILAAFVIGLAMIISAAIRS